MTAECLHSSIVQSVRSIETIKIFVPGLDRTAEPILCYKSINKTWRKVAANSNLSSIIYVKMLLLSQCRNSVCPTLHVNKVAFQSKADYLQRGYTFFSCDLDLDSMTLIYELRYFKTYLSPCARAQHQNEVSRNTFLRNSVRAVPSSVKDRGPDCKQSLNQNWSVSGAIRGYMLYIWPG